MALSLGLLFVFSKLPFSWQRWIGRRLGGVMFRIMKRRRQITEVNLALCFPELGAKARTSMVREVFNNNAIGLFESAWAWWASDQRLEPCFEVRGLEHIAAAKAEGFGVLLTGGHYSSLDLGGRLMGMVTDYHLIYRPHNNALFQSVLSKGRLFCAGQIDNRNTRQAIRALRKGDTVWFAPDQDMGPKQSIYAPFFGIEAATVPSAAKLAKLGNAKVLMFGQQRLENGRYLITVEPALENFPSEDLAADTAKINLELERLIKMSPAQYMWAHRRFKTHPEGKNFRYSAEQRKKRLG